MRLLVYLLLVLSIVMNVSACGHKGKLKSPEQIARKEEKKKKEEEKKQEESKPSVAPAPVEEQPVSAPPPVQEQQ